MKFTIQHVIYVIKQSVSPKMFTNESLFTIQWLLYQDSTVFMSLFDCCTLLKALFGFQFRLFMSFSYAMQCVPNYG